MLQSSLIFLAIVAIWAAYLTQHFIRRRDALATARSVDQFSESMRLLQRRPAVQTSGVAHMQEPAAHDTRPAAPEVSVKAPRVAAQRAGASILDKARSVNQRQLRGIALLACAGLWLVSLVLAPFGLVPWWAPVLLVFAVVGVVAWLRTSAMKQRSVARTRPQAAPRAKVRSSAPATRLPSVPAAASGPAASTVAAAATIAAPSVEVFDVNKGATAQVATPAAEPVAAAVASDDGWSPVAVPRPTYTMKAKAERVEAAPAATTPTSYEHVAIEDLPFDGLALDEDVDVPEHFRAG